MRWIGTFFCLATCFSALCLEAAAQEVVHAVEGTIQNIDQKSGTLTLTNNNSTGGDFKAAAASGANLSVEKELRVDLVPASKFSDKGDKVVLLYEGYGNQRTAIAVHTLGSGVVTNLKGTVERTDKRPHTVTLKTDDGNQQTIHVDPKTIATHRLVS